MRLVKWLFAILFGLAGLPIFFFTLFIAFTPSTDQFYRLHSTDIELIDTATQFINNFRANHSRLPTGSEFLEWVATMDQEEFRYEGRGYSYDEGPFTKELITRFGSPPEGAFTLSFFNGNAFVTYPSWFGDGKLAYISDADYFFFGGKFADVAVFFAISILLFSLVVALTIV